MRDEQNRPRSALLAEAPQDRALVEGVQIARRLVEEQKGRAMQEGTRKPQPLPLTTRERVAQLADHRVVPLGEAHDEIVH